jgi:glycosyltransferase involved in cell wall biosynthesis
VTPSRSLRIAIDLSAVLPGGDNGGAKILTLTLLEALGTVAPRHRYLLLTARDSHDEFAHLEALGMERRCVLESRGTAGGQAPVGPAVSGAGPARLLRALRPLVPAAARRVGNRAWARLRGEPGVGYGEPDPRNRGLLEEGVDVLFCPFTAPVRAEPDLPVVSVVHDLQHVSYPQFFSGQENANREALLRVVAARADHVVCVSDYTREMLLAHLAVPAERVSTVPNAVYGRLPRLRADETAAGLDGLGLSRAFVLYPANFWPHKNHRLLLAAYGSLRAHRPQLALDLVFTGALPEAARELQEDARRMGLAPFVHFPGYLSDRALAALYEGCRLVVFPSLYEGFGIPVLEAMYFGKPIACSSVASLPEVAGDAAVLFDPRRPAAIEAAILRIVDEPALSSELVERGRRRLQLFGAERMARGYLEAFASAAGTSPMSREGLHDVHPDGWVGGRASLVPGDGRRACEVDLHVPWSVKARQVTVFAHRTGGESLGEWRIARGARATLSIPLNGRPERVQLRFAPVFRPSDIGIGDDRRMLSCRCEAFRLLV